MPDRRSISSTAPRNEVPRNVAAAMSSRFALWALWVASFLVRKLLNVRLLLHPSRPLPGLMPAAIEESSARFSAFNDCISCNSRRCWLICWMHFSELAIPCRRVQMVFNLEFKYVYILLKILPTVVSKFAKLCTLVPQSKAKKNLILRSQGVQVSTSVTNLHVCRFFNTWHVGRK